jgi:hypothetical protein
MEESALNQQNQRHLRLIPKYKAVSKNRDGFFDYSKNTEEVIYILSKLIK